MTNINDENICDFLRVLRLVCEVYVECWTNLLLKLRVFYLML
jgi:hypothetical protein